MICGCPQKNCTATSPDHAAAGATVRRKPSPRDMAPCIPIHARTTSGVNGHSFTNTMWPAQACRTANPEKPKTSAATMRRGNRTTQAPPQREHARQRNPETEHRLDVENCSRGKEREQPVGRKEHAGLARREVRCARHDARVPLRDPQAPQCLSEIGTEPIPVPGNIPVMVGEHPAVRKRRAEVKRQQRRKRNKHDQQIRPGAADTFRAFAQKLFKQAHERGSGLAAANHHSTAPPTAHKASSGARLHRPSSPGRCPRFCPSCPYSNSRRRWRGNSHT